MKPLNADNSTCTPISSNCVIWQGPDIECIKLCKGDTISDITAKLATELCGIMKTLDITSYDLSCFNLTSCAPEDFQALIQFLISRVCKLEQCTGCIPDCNGNDVPTPTPVPVAGCPDCLVSVATCFQYTNEFGDLVTSMQLVDYVRSIGALICQNIGNITTIREIVVVQQKSIEELQVKTSIPIVFTLPEFTPVCVLPAVPTDIATILQALEQQFCALRSATGTPDQIYQAIVKQCSGLSTAPALGTTGGSMGSIPGWVNSPVNAADTLTNIWLTICDLRSAVANIKLNCCPDGCDGISVDMQLTLTGTVLKLFFTGNVPAGFQNCNPNGVLFTITDTSGGLVNVYVDVVGNMNNINGVSIDLGATPINILNNLTVVGNPCFENTVTNATCQSCLEKIYYNVAVCPALSLVPLDTSISYSAAAGVGTINYKIEVWDAAGITLITSFNQTITGPGIFTGQIGGLTAGTLYKVRLVLTISGVETPCPFQSITTTGSACAAPEAVVPSIVITP